VQGCKCTPKRFDLWKIRKKSLKIWAKSMKTFAKYVNMWAPNTVAKMAPNVV